MSLGKDPIIFNIGDPLRTPVRAATGRGYAIALLVLSLATFAQPQSEAPSVVLFRNVGAHLRREERHAVDPIECAGARQQDSENLNYGDRH